MSQIDIVELGLSIKEARLARGLTQGQVAVAIGSSRTRVVAFENGRNPDMAFSAVLRMMNVVGLDFAMAQAREHPPTLDEIRREQAEEDERNARRGSPRPRW
jgi:transcriptional regulator with XRE-family HTH domain